MSSFEIKENIHWVGARDWNVRSFHGPELSTHRGTTYNSYVIQDEKNVLVDGVYKGFIDIHKKHIAEVVDPGDIDYYVVNHTEPDHSASFPAVMDWLSEETVVLCSQKGKEGLQEHYGNNYNFQVVQTGDNINLGKKSISFVTAPMLHWPDSMFTYVPETKLLLPNDAFGMHLSVSNLFDDKNSKSLLLSEAKKYYANILTPFSDLVLRKLDEIQKMGLEIDMIAPSHGVIWRKNPELIINKYSKWATMESGDKAVIVYDTMWDSTEKVAKLILEGLMAEEIEAKFYRLSAADNSDIITEILDTSAVIIGSPTINNVMLPNITSLLEELTGLKFKDKTGAAFGSKGWAGGASKRIAERMGEAGIEMVKEPFEFQYVPSEKQLKEAYQLGVRIGKKIKG